VHSKPLALGVLISGRGSNLMAINEAIENNLLKAKLLLVVSNNKNAAGILWAKEKGLNAIVLEPHDYPDSQHYEDDLIKQLLKAGVEWVALAGYMRLISPKFLEVFKGKVVNIHPSLLPAFPGLEAQKRALEYGVKFSGCTVHFVDEKMDHGPIIAQAVVPVFDDDTPESLADRILKKEHKIYPKILQLIAEGRIKIEGRRVITSVGGRIK